VDLEARCEPVLETARTYAADVDAAARFPTEAVEALRASGLLGLTLPTEVCGLGAGPVEFSQVTARLAAACGSTAMIYLMHVSAAMTAAAAPPPSLPQVLTAMASGRTLATLAFSESGSRSHFWAPASRATLDGDGQVRLAAEKSFVTSAGQADLYVVCTLSADAGTGDGAVDLYAVAADTPGVAVAGAWRGMGLRGNASAPMRIEVSLSEGHRIGKPGAGFELMTGTVMPWFNLGNAAVSLGLATAACDAAISHASTARLQHLGQTLAELPTVRARIARMALRRAVTESYVRTASASIAAPDEQTALHVLGVKALANDAALEVTDEAMRICGGAAFSAHLQVERIFRDARAGHVMAPTADVLYDFYGKAVTGQPLF